MARHTSVSVALLLACSMVNLRAQGDGRDLMLRLRTNVLKTIERLPKYMCTETIERSVYRPDVRLMNPSCDWSSSGAHRQKIVLATTDRLRLDVALGPLREIFSWHGIDRFDDKDLVDMVSDGAISTGEFGGFISTIFGSSAALFTYHGEVPDARGRRVAEFSFEVPQEKSKDEFGRHGRRGITGYSGTIRADLETAELIELTIRTARLPAGTGACEATTTLNYGRAPTNGSEVLLPSEARFRIALQDGNESENRITFGGCREFHAESRVSFDPPASSGRGDSVAKPKDSLPPLNLPVGLPFRTKLMDDIDTQSAAAGDAVRMKLISAIRNPDTKTVAAEAGVEIGARLVSVQHTHGTQPTVWVLIRLETIEIAGVKRDFAAGHAPPVQRFEAGRGPFTRQRALLGTFDTLEGRPGQLFSQEKKPNHVFRSGEEMKWVTTRSLEDTGAEEPADFPSIAVPR